MRIRIVKVLIALLLFNLVPLDIVILATSDHEEIDIDLEMTEESDNPSFNEEEIGDLESNTESEFIEQEDEDEIGDEEEFIGTDEESSNATEETSKNDSSTQYLDETRDLENKETSELQSQAPESRTSKLGHIRNANVRIYDSYTNLSNYQTAGSSLTNAVYYIKLQADYNGETFYLLSTQPSAVNGVVGWAKATDLSSNDHVGINNQSKNFYIKGTGSAYSKAWGGSKDLVFEDMSAFSGQTFSVHLTERVGNNTWYRGRLNGEVVWLHSSYVSDSSPALREGSTSRLGHIRNSNVRIYSNLRNMSNFTTASSTYTNAVYYIKRAAVLNYERYYLISTEPSATRSVIGWVKADDLSSHPHVGVDKDSKTFYVNGEGSAYGKAWGGQRDIVYSDLSEYANYNFEVHLTEQVGNNIWYRGRLDGEVVWLHSSYVNETPALRQGSTSRLGHIRNSSVRIYSNLRSKSNYTIAGSNYTNTVYYIKRSAVMENIRYYLISTEPSATNGVIGWVKADNLSSHPHVGVDREDKIFYLTGRGQAFTKAWGGSKDLVYNNLGSMTNQQFRVHLTERIGNNIWYRGRLNGNVVWIHSSYVSDSTTRYTNYSRTLSQIVDIQMTVRPQTDKYRNSPAYVHSSLVNRSGSNGVINGNSVRVRSEPTTNSHTYISYNAGQQVSILGQTTGTTVSGSNVWYQISLGQWRLPTRSDLTQFLDPSIQDPFQFLVLSEPAGASANVLNRHLSSEGVLNNKGTKFIEAARAYGVNEVYLVSHAILESNNGRSALARGVRVGRNSSGSPTLVDSSNANSLTDIKTVYNMYGIGAFDGVALSQGAIRAYNEGWTSVDLAIVEGAQFVSSSYFNRGQDTLYKMRWNPANPGSMQYATDIGWASKQVSRMKAIYDQIENPSMVFDIPVFR
ncbi:bifunctional autolysin [Amphibacillus marinus]|uniref:Bifunctional autolysin n=1 Tax=Amphibacillus marinus TaxID=872970 RepID=A0A1H8N4M8_9BACI|nr:N-acetylglucosaminidase [Amphibacillus marinus]SEO24428.1 bifunctional autolysin [Amphibacillus marinus]